jgi:hypothetical protein
MNIPEMFEFVEWMFSSAGNTGIGQTRWNHDHINAEGSATCPANLSLVS